MIYLYRFEVRTADAEMFGGFAAGPSYASNDAGKSRSVYLLTNGEREVAMSGSDPFAVPFLANAGYASYAVDGWVRFQPALISHDEVRLDGEDSAGELRVRLPPGHPLSQLYALDAPSAQVWLTLALKDADAAPLVIYVGRVRQAEFAEDACTLSLMPLHDVLKRPGLTRKHARGAYGSLIDHVPEVNAVVATGFGYDYFKYREDGFITAVSGDGAELTVPEASYRLTDFFTGGLAIINSPSYQVGMQAAKHKQHYPRATASSYISVPVDNWQPSGGTRRGIVAHTGAVVTLAGRVPAGVAVGDKVTLYCGVPASLVAYAARFGNAHLYNGFPFIPSKNPYQSGIR